MCLLFIWSDVTVREYTRRLHTSECKIKIQKITYLFITIKVQLITISSVIPYISETNSTSNSLKKKKKTSREEGGGKGKRERKEKEMEKRRRRKKRGRTRRKERKKGE